MKAFATIRHNDDDTQRVTLYDNNGIVWAAAEGEEPYNTDTPTERASTSWGGEEWDYQPITREIAIYMDDVWAGTGQITADGVIENCSAQFCDDNDESIEVYDKIEEAIRTGEKRLTVTLDGEEHKLEWTIRDDE